MATFYAYFDRIVPAQNKYMATLWNSAAARKLSITKVIWLANGITAVVGVPHDMYVARITARTAGTAVTIRPRDSIDTLTAGIAADTNSSAVTEGYIMQRFVGSSEEAPVTTTALNTYYGSLGGAGVVMYAKLPGTTPEVLRVNQGLAIRTLTASTVGVMSFLIEFTDDLA